MNWDATALSANDNVAIVLRPVQAGETINVAAGATMVAITAVESIALCHKIALVDVAAGAPIVKYGECIGHAVAPIQRGTWVHTHNLRSRRARASNVT